jgi:anti-sigma regulatory factor (Ser/Thr protein kinase)
MIDNVVSPSISKQYNVVIDEIFSNIVKYGFKTKNDSNFINIKLKIDNREKLITMIFEDNGIKFNPLEREDPNIKLSADERNEGGLGIYIVKKMMDKVTYEYKDNKNYLILNKKY